MFGFIAEKLTAVVSDTYDGVAAIGNYIADDIASIPDAVEKGWNEGLFVGDETTEPTEEKPEPNDI